MANDPASTKSDSLNLDGCVLPQGFDADSFSSAFNDLQSIVGAENVELVRVKELQDKSYHGPPMTHDPFHILDQDSFISSSVVCPGSTEEVQQIMNAANKHHIPLWPVSIGRNFGYGGAAPRVRGSVVVDLGRRMNKILEINEPGAFALVEPGVTFQGLYDEIKKRGLSFTIDVPDLGGGSVLGNTVERGVGYTPYGDHFMIHCGMEVVLPNGEVVRTGMGSLPDSRQPTGSANTWQLFPYGFGPYHDGIFTQSNYGIVTKLGYWLLPDLGGYQHYMIAFQKDEDLPKAIDIIRPLRLAGLLQNAPSIRNCTLDMAVEGPRTKYSSSGKPLTDEELQAAVDTREFGRWTFYGAIYGPKPVRDIFWGAIKGAFSQVEGAEFFLPEDVPKSETSQPKVIHIRQETLAGIPSTHELKWTEFVPNGSTFFFSPISPVSGTETVKQYQIAKRRFHEFDFDYLGTFTIGMRELHHIVIVVFNRHDAEEKKRAIEMMRLLVDDCAKEGYGEYRTHLALMDQIAGTYNYNDNSIMKLNEQLKDALDPNGILAPGKSGVWGKKYREGKMKYTTGLYLP